MGSSYLQIFKIYLSLRKNQCIEFLNECNKSNPPFHLCASNSNALHNCSWNFIYAHNAQSFLLKQIKTTSLKSIWYCGGFFFDAVRFKFLITFAAVPCIETLAIESACLKPGPCFQQFLACLKRRWLSRVIARCKREPNS